MIKMNFLKSEIRYFTGCFGLKNCGCFSPEIQVCKNSFEALNQDIVSFK